MAGKCEWSISRIRLWWGRYEPLRHHGLAVFHGGRWTDQPIRGIDTLDLMVAFKRIYKIRLTMNCPEVIVWRGLLAQSLVVVSNPAQLLFEGLRQDMGGIPRI